MKYKGIGSRILSWILTVALFLGTVSGLSPVVVSATDKSGDTKASSTNTLLQKGQDLLSRINGLEEPGDRNGLVDLTQHDADVGGLRGDYYLMINYGGNQYVVDGSGSFITHEDTPKVDRLRPISGFEVEEFSLKPNGAFSPANAFALVPVRFVQSDPVSYIVMFSNGKSLIDGEDLHGSTKAEVASAKASIDSSNHIWIHHSEGSSFVSFRRNIDYKGETKKYLLEYNVSTA